MRQSVISLLVLLVCVTAEASSHDGYPITREQVCRALQVDEQDCALAVEILGAPVASAPGVRLEAARISRSPLGRQVTLRCDGSACIPFLILLHQSPATPEPAKARPVRVEPRPIAVRPGDRAQLVQIADGIRLTRTVICVDRGRIGDVIRVRELQGKSILRASVESPGLLIAAF